MSRRGGLKSAGELSPARRLGVGLAAAAATLAVIAVAVAVWAGWSYAGPGPKAAQDGETTVVAAPARAFGPGPA